MRKNARFIAIFLPISLIALIYGIGNFYRAFPEIGINMALSRGEVEERARRFLEGRGFSLEGMKRSIIFTYQGRAKLYVERQAGVEKVIEVADTVGLWFWEVRFFRPLHIVEYWVKVNPAGEVIGFRRKWPEDEPGAFLDTLSVQELARAFLFQRWGLDSSQWRLISLSSEDRPRRRDWELTWERADYKVVEAPLRLTLTIQGAEVGGMERFLRVPPEWWRTWDKQRAQNELFQTIASAMSALTIIAIFIGLFSNVRRGKIPWRTALGLGGALMVVNIIMGFNSLPLTLPSYQTTETYSAHFWKTVLSFSLNGLVEGLLLVLLFGAGERLYRQAHPEKLFLPHLFHRRGFLSREMFQGTLMGYSLAAFHIGFVVFFYVVGKSLGFWAPADIDYDNAVSTAFPWIYPLAISMGAALLEEFWFRLWGVSFFTRLFRSRVIGLILPALIWGFLHSNYPQQPGYVRGVEVGLIGILAGYIMLRFGIWATLTWHFVVDGIFIGLFLFRSPHPYFWISGILVCGFLAIPAVVAGVVYLRRRSLPSVEELTNRRAEMELEGEAVTLPPPQPLPATTSSQSLSPASRVWTWIVGLGGLAIAFIPLEERFGAHFKPLRDLSAARQIAQEEIERHYSIDTDTFIVGVTYPSERIAQVGTSGIPYQNRRFSFMSSYLRRYGTLKEAESLLFHPRVLGSPAWWVVLKSPNVAEEFGAVVPMRGEEPMLWHYLPDSARGADLGEREALILASQLFTRLEANPDSFRVVEKASVRRPNRRDWTIEWESLSPFVGEAHLRQVVRVKGDEVEVGERYLKVPESWERQEEKETSWMLFRRAMAPLLLFGLGIWAIIFIGRELKGRRLTWRNGLILGGVVGVAQIVAVWCESPSLWWFYNTAVSPRHFLSLVVMGQAIGVVFLSLLMAVVVALAEAIGRHLDARAPWAGWGEGVTLFRQGWVMALGGAGLLAGVTGLLRLATHIFNLPEHDYQFSLPDFLNGNALFLYFIATILKTTLLLSSVVWVFYHLIKMTIPRPGLRLLFYILIVYALDVWIKPRTGGYTWGEEVWSLVQSGVFVAAVYGALRVWFERSLWAAMLGLGLAVIFRNGLLLSSWSDSPYAPVGWLILTLGLLVWGGGYLWGGPKRTLQTETFIS